MTIVFGSYQICDGRDEATEEQFVVTTQHTAQTQTGARWANVVNFNRYNTSYIVSFSSTESFGNLGSAEFYVATRGNTLKQIGKADLRVTFSDTTGFKLFRNAVLTGCTARRIGICAIFSYTFVAESVE